LASGRTRPSLSASSGDSASSTRNTPPQR
jgi:hypothetical protein